MFNANSGIVINNTFPLQRRHALKQRSTQLLYHRYKYTINSFHSFQAICSVIRKNLYKLIFIPDINGFARLSFKFIITLECDTVLVCYKQYIILIKSLKSNGLFVFN